MHSRIISYRQRLLSLTSSAVKFASASATVRDSAEPNLGMKPFSAIPGPKPLPVLRNLFELRRNMTKFHLYFEECHKKYGEIFKFEAPVSAKFVYNTDLHTLDNPTEETEQFIEGVVLFMDCMAKLAIEPPLHRLYPNKLYRDFKKSLKITKKYGMKHAEKVRQKIEAGEEESEVQGLLEQWLREGKMNEEEALMLSADMFFAGVDTTSNQAAFLLYLMAKNPEAQEELYQQIRSVLGDCTLPTAEDLSKIPYLKGCMMESFRMESTSLGNPRILQEEITLSGYHIPAQTNIWYLSFLAGKDEQFFPNPERFDPARWERDKPHPQFAVLPFGFGPRSCYGRRFAELELKLLLCQITRSFVLGTDLENLDKEMSLVVRPAVDLPIFFKDRNN